MQALGWPERADSRHGYLALRADDARTLLTDLPRWHASRITGGYYPLRTDATDDLPFEQWMLAARHSPTPPPPLGANAELLDSVAWQNSRARWEDLAQGKKLYVVRFNTGTGAQWARVLADSRRQVLAVKPDFAVWPEMLAEWSTDLAEQVAVVKTWVPNLITEEIELRVIG